MWQRCGGMGWKKVQRVGLCGKAATKGRVGFPLISNIQQLQEDALPLTCLVMLVINLTENVDFPFPSGHSAYNVKTIEKMKYWETIEKMTCTMQDSGLPSEPSLKASFVKRNVLVLLSFWNLKRLLGGSRQLFRSVSSSLAFLEGVRYLFN